MVRQSLRAAGQGSGTISAFSPIAYSVVGVADFNTDGIVDILSRNDTSGDTGYLALNKGGGAGAWHDLGVSSTAYTVVNPPHSG